MTIKYLPQEFENKWLIKWDKEKIGQFDEKSKNKKFYVLVELPYTSGDLHIGHWFAFTIPDVVSRYKKMQGFNVLFPNGYDAFGLPAENAAIKRNIHPKDWTMSNINTMNAQFGTMGTMIDWRYTAITCQPDYYRWNQWIFLKMYEKGMIYRGNLLSNWCEKDQTVLANENVEAGKCWRCGTAVVQKEVAQWFIKITDYADKLIWPATPSVDWPVSVRVGQNNWIGKSEGMILKFEIENGGVIECFTTKPETTDGATFIVLSPEHPYVEKLIAQNPENKIEIEKYVEYAKKKSELARKENKEKTGVFTGTYATNPVTSKKMPVWIADYVLWGYGTGSVMAVPYADIRDKEFAVKFKLPIEKTSFTAKPVGQKIANYHIHDWSISRQRYWGTPVPMVHCPDCGIVPVPEHDLPIELPYEIDFSLTGKPPLATNEKWMNVKCPKCNKDAKRDAETLDTFFDSSWYFYRYLSPTYTKGPFDTGKVRDFMPVDIYFGGAEHTLGHTLYARFFTKFFHDIGLVKFDEFAKKRIQHGVILGPDGGRMSKSKGNVINPDEVVKEYGTDTVRMYLCFIMPYEATGPWSVSTIAGVHRFLTRVWNIFHKLDINSKSPEDKKLLHQLNIMIKKVGEDIESIKLNTAVAAMMEFINHWEGMPNSLSVENAKKFLLVLSPFAPFITEEIWRSVLSEKSSIHNSSWPAVDKDALVEDEIIIPVQINGKFRISIKIRSDEHDEDRIVKKALEQEKVKQYIGDKKYKVIYVPFKILNFVTS